MLPANSINNKFCCKRSAKFKNHCPRKLMFSTMKRYAVGAGAFVAGAVALLASTCSAASIISLPSTAVADLTGSASQIMTDVWVLVALAIGIPLGFYIIRKVIALIPKH